MSKILKQEECNCIILVSERVKADFAARQSKRKKGFKILAGVWESLTITPDSRLFTTFNIMSTYETSDGQRSEPIHSYIGVKFFYCPFCGKQLPKD